MKKDVVYSIRMRSHVRDALRRAAKKERRTVASLLDKIILDYLEKEGDYSASTGGSERRVFPRKQMTLPATLTVNEKEEQAKEKSFPGIILNVSEGGVLVTYPKGTNITLNSLGQLPSFEISFQLPESREPLRFRCNARRMNQIGDQIQIGAIFDEPQSTAIDELQSYLV